MSLRVATWDALRDACLCGTQCATICAGACIVGAAKCICSVAEALAACGEIHGLSELKKNQLQNVYSVSLVQGLFSAALFEGAEGNFPKGRRNTRNVAFTSHF